MSFWNKISFLFLAILINLNLIASDQLPEKPNPPKLVNDFVGVLSNAQNQALEQKLVQFNNQSSTQIAIVVVDDLLGYDRAEYTIQLAEKWQIGQKGKDNGILIMIKPTGNSGQRSAFIAVGYGLEGVIPDAIANRIVENEMIPQFKNGDIYQGLENAVNTLMSLSSGEFSADEYQKADDKKSIFAFFIFLIVLVVFIILVPSSQAFSYMRTHNIGYWAALWLILSSGRTSGSGTFGHFTNGTGGFGGFGGGGRGFGGGGGFGGFGGGSFGGGGAGGSW
ncbi:MAG: TPM domain-containing protein [Bacteroidales bacterium]|nr:TPM domain-containing protein [Bacteroidales bacterium]